jgi:hypothetical protein
MTETLSIFIASYFGVALGRIPGLMLDRTGIALLNICFRARARVGIPVTILSLIVLAGWIAV